MNRKEFIKGSAIIGASLTVPELLNANTGLIDSENQRKVHQIITAQRTMVGTLPVLRAFAGDNNDFVSPYVFFDEFGPVNLNPQSTPLKVEAHPHAGIVPTTFFLAGSGHHRDSLNYDFQIGKGDFMMFSSGRGAIHMEETGQKLFDDGGLYHGFQIWLNMPSEFKFTAPKTDVFREEKMNEVKTDSYYLKIVLGEAFGKKSSIETLSPTFYFYVKLKANTKFEIPTDPTHNAFLYLVNGELELEGRKKLEKNQVALFERGKSTIQVFSKNETEFLLMGGKPLNEPVFAYGPFVMNNEQQIRQCYIDYQSGKMGNPNEVNGH
jgi:redox-sensitive bicupin YhaK (pirin superfamily)